MESQLYSPPEGEENCMIQHRQMDFTCQLSRDCLKKSIFPTMDYVY